MADETYFEGGIKLDKIVGSDDAQAATIADAAVTATLTGFNGTDFFMTAAQAATIVADLTSLTTKLNSALAALENVGVLADS